MRERHERLVEGADPHVMASPTSAKIFNPVAHLYPVCPRKYCTSCWHKIMG